MVETRSRASLIRRWTVIGATMQLVMVLVGHWVAAIASVFGILGTLIALVVGLLFARQAGGGLWAAIVGGALAAGISALVGVAVSFALGDVTRDIILIATASGLIAGAIGAVIGHATATRAAGPV